MASKIKSFYKNMIKYKYQIVTALMMLILLIAAYEYYSKYSYYFKNPKRIRQFIMSYGKYGVIVFFMLQVAQVIAFFIPGEIVQIAGGFIYGTLVGGMISLAGITAGSALAYGVSHTYGKPLVNKLISEKDLKYFSKALNSGSIDQVVFLLYLIPGIPKDVLAYVCGISSISWRNFMIYSTLGRLPGILISAYFGANINAGKNGLLVFIAIAMSLLFVLGVWRGDRIVRRITKKHKSS